MNVHHQFRAARRQPQPQGWSSKVMGAREAQPRQHVLSVRRLAGRGSSSPISQVSLVFADKWVLLLVSV